MSSPIPMRLDAGSAHALALRPRDAATALGISERLLWSLSTPRGPIPCTRVGGRGGCVLYRVADLDAWLTRQGQPAKGGGDDNAS
jgi:hypothetical protein